MISEVLPALAGEMTLIGCPTGQSCAATAFAPSTNTNAATDHGFLRLPKRHPMNALPWELSQA
jgi:hypothetical protein